MKNSEEVGDIEIFFVDGDRMFIKEYVIENQQRAIPNYVSHRDGWFLVEAYEEDFGRKYYSFPSSSILRIEIKKPKGDWGNKI